MVEMTWSSRFCRMLLFSVYPLLFIRYVVSIVVDVVVVVVLLLVVVVIVVVVGLVVL